MSVEAKHLSHAEPNYIAVFVVLFALTVVEVAVVYFHFLPKMVSPSRWWSWPSPRRSSSRPTSCT